MALLVHMIENGQDGGRDEAMRALSGFVRHSEHVCSFFHLLY